MKMSSFQRNSSKLPQQLANEKLANDFKQTSRHKQPFSKDENENNFEIEISELKNKKEKEEPIYENMFNPILQMSNRQQIPERKEHDRASPLSKTPDSMDDGWASSANSSAMHTTLSRNNQSNSTSSVSPSNESLKRGGISSGVGTQSDEMLDEYSIDDIGEDIQVIEDMQDEEYEEEEDIIDDDDDDDEEDQETLRLQMEAEKLKNSKVTKQAPLPLLPKISETHKHFNSFFNQIISDERPFNAKLAYLIGFRFDLEKYCMDATSADLNVLFTHVEQIFEQHNLFLNELKRILNDLMRSDLLSLLLNALKVFSVMLSTCLKLYCEFLDNYPKAMVILNKFEAEKYKTNQTMINSLKISNSQSQKHRQQQQKSKTFVECESEFFQNIYTNNEFCDTAHIFSNELLNHPLALVRNWLRLKDECLYFIKISTTSNRNSNQEIQLKMKINELFYDNLEYNKLKHEIFTKIDRILLPNQMRKNEDVVELCEGNEKKLRHLILFSDCLICCRIKK